MKFNFKTVSWALLLILLVFITWRLIKPLNIYDISERFERPVNTDKIPEPLKNLNAKECAQCHKEHYDEWKTSIHSRAWTDKYFQVDLALDGSSQNCENCHIPLDRQQKNQIAGFKGGNKWSPILIKNPGFDHALQQEGVNCAGCHLRDGQILGTKGDGKAPHPVKKINDGKEICMRCHVVEGDKWDTFYNIPPCGTVAEIEMSKGTRHTTKTLGCVECHMPETVRSITPEGEPQKSRRHLWRGGHDPETVKTALDIKIKQTTSEKGKPVFTMTITNIGAAHFIPTGTPDRKLEVRWELLNAAEKLIADQASIIKRKIVWRPFIVDLWDTRLRLNEPREYTFKLLDYGKEVAAFLDIEVTYHLLDEARRKRIGYIPEKPISYPVFKTRITIEKTES